ncbi:hypothetical protein [Bradyrhizobium sp. WSM3983]|uniref:hypothetical protein n=1 Tax=Bradyrhizobium sp. WSM3983 TaxID=1038867 RepID=UPI00041782AC|nr:hypothetical protein [Bradyrhizobium sp. WSM3983]
MARHILLKAKAHQHFFRPECADEISIASSRFRALARQGYLAVVKEEGGLAISGEFNPAAEETIFIRTGRNHGSPTAALTSALATLHERIGNALAASGSVIDPRVLLENWLAADQRLQFEATRTFTAVGARTGARFRISSGPPPTVIRLDQAGGPEDRSFALPDAKASPEINMLIWKVVLELDQQSLLDEIDASASSAVECIPVLFPPG